MSQDNTPRQNNKPRRTVKKTPKKITASYLHNAGLYYLQRFAASKAHFKTVMMRKVRLSCAAHPDQDFLACEALVDALLDTFERAGLLNDPVYAKAQVTSLRRRGTSKKIIAMKLKTKGLDQALTLETIEGHDTDHGTDSDAAELEAAFIHARKKKLGPFRTRGENRPEKDLSNMARAGFSYDTARSVLQSCLNIDPHHE